jgi:tetratricopeptide (TPR) repeat protein
MEKIVKWLLPAFFWFCAPAALGQEAQDSTVVAPEIVLYNKAVLLIDSADYKEALPILKKAVKLKPEYFEAFNKSAFARIKLGEYKEAIKDLEKAEKAAPMNYESQKLRGIAYFLTQQYALAKPALDTANFIATEELIEDAELQYYRARLMYEGKSYKNALGASELALEYKPNYLEAMVLKGRIRFAMKEYNYAIRYLTEAIAKMDSTSIDYAAYELRAKARAETGDFKGAAADWTVYLKGNPKSEEALISRAASRINFNDHSAAISDLDEAIRINGRNPVSYCYRGVAKSGNRNFEEAMKDLNYSIKLKFDYPTAYVNRAAIRMAQGHKHEACDDLKKAESLGSESAIRLIEKHCK